jgi:type I restriction enzyme S subunit
MKSKSQNHFMPKLKFKSFISDWEKVLLGELSTKVNQKNNDFFYDQVLTNSATKGIVLQSDYFERAIVSKGNIDGYYIVKKDDFVYNPRISKNAPVGPISRNKLIDGVMSPLYTVFRVKNMNLDFIDHYFKSNHWHRYMKSVANYGARHDRMAISKKDFFKLPIPTPSIEEQNKIAEFLSSVDKKIQLLEKKKEQLELYKKGVMQKIFSQEIRFKDDNGNSYPDWERSVLADLFSSKRGQGLSGKNITEDGKNKCILYGALYTKYDEVIFDVVEKTNEIGSVQSLMGDLLVPASTTTSGIDLANFTALDEDGIYLGGDITIMRSKEKSSNKFWAYYLTHFKKFDVAKYAQGTTIVHLYFNHFKKIKVDVPSYDEQKKIADFILVLDKKIKSTSTLIDKTKEFKKGLLQQMFV